MLLPGSDQVMLTARVRWDGKYPPGNLGPDGNPEVVMLYDTNTGTYTTQPNRDSAFCG
jgi:hypothetical protein